MKSKTLFYMGPVILAVALTLVSASAHAGNEGAHGGNAMVCFKTKAIRDEVKKVLVANLNNPFPDDALGEVQTREGPKDPLADIQSVELLELYQKKSLSNGSEPVTPADFPGLTAEQIVEQYHLAFSEVTDFGDKLSEVSAAIPFTSWVKSDTGIKSSDDVGLSGNLSPLCVVIQIARQEWSGSTFSRITYDPRLYAKMNVVHQAALHDHEFIYYLNIKIDRFTRNILAVQAVNSFIYSRELRIRQNAGQLDGDYINRRIEDAKIVFTKLSSFVTTRLTLSDGSSLSFRNVTITPDSYEGVAMDKVHYRGMTFLSEWEYRKFCLSSSCRQGPKVVIDRKTLALVKGWPANGFSSAGIKFQGPDIWDGIDRTPEDIELYTTGVVRKAVIAEDTKIGEYTFRGPAQFYPSGKLQVGILAHKTEIYGIEVDERTKLYFTEAGDLSGFTLSDRERYDSRLSIQGITCLSDTKKDGPVFEFYPSGSLLSCRKDQYPEIKAKDRVFDGAEVKSNSLSNAVLFYDTGKARSINPPVRRISLNTTSDASGPWEGIVYHQPTRRPVQGVHCSINEGDYVYFFRDGTLQSCVLAQDQHLSGQDMKANEQVEFDQNRLAIRHGFDHWVVDQQ